MSGVVPVRMVIGTWPFRAGDEVWLSRTHTHWRQSNQKLGGELVQSIRRLAVRLMSR